MQRQLSLVELAVYGYDPTRVKKGSWLEKQFGTTNKEVKDSGEHIRRSDQDKEQQTGR